MAAGKYQYWLTDDGRTLLQGWARDGLTDEQIAHNIGITAATLYVWKNKYPEISETLKKAKKSLTMKLKTPCLNVQLAMSIVRIVWR